MVRRKRNLIKINSRIIALLMILFSTSCTSSNKELAEVFETCKDLLATWGEKPEALQFQHCEIDPDFRGAKSFSVVYFVNGSDAAEVEKFLQNKFAMHPLKFLCCYWEPVHDKGDVYAEGEGNYTDEEGESFSIGMYSQETPKNLREEWDEISFTVRVRNTWGI